MKARYPIDSKLEEPPKTTEASALQLLNAQSPMDVTEAGMRMDLIPTREKAKSPIVASDDEGRETDIKDAASAKA